MFDQCKIHGVRDTDYDAFGTELENKMRQLEKENQLVDIQLQFVPLDGGVEYNAFIYYKSK